MAKTTRGYLRGKTKEELKKVIECFWSEASAEAIIDVGGRSTFRRWVYATYAGFSSHKEADEFSFTCTVTFGVRR